MGILALVWLDFYHKQVMFAMFCPNFGVFFLRFCCSYGRFQDDMTRPNTFFRARGHRKTAEARDAASVRKLFFNQSGMMVSKGNHPMSQHFQAVI